MGISVLELRHLLLGGHRRKGRVRNNIEEKEEKREEDKVGKETRALQVPCGSETYGYSRENNR